MRKILLVAVVILSLALMMCACEEKDPKIDILTVPASRSTPATVSGILSPSSSTRRIMNWPGFAFLATRGASISIPVTVGLRTVFEAILYIFRFLSVILSLLYSKHRVFASKKAAFPAALFSKRITCSF